jgi:Xaa-Pro aminopeptidase
MAVLIWGDTIRTPALRHEVPLAIIDPFLYLESNGTRAVMAWTVELPRLQELGGLEIVTTQQLGEDALANSGREWWDFAYELAVRAVGHFAIESATVPPEFPLELADRLRAQGVEVASDGAEFVRRRAKTAAEIEGVRRAQKAAEAAMTHAADLLRDGGELTAEQVRAEMIAICREHGATLPADVIVGPGAQGAVGHEAGSGVLPPETPIIIDIWPVDDESACFADMTRTFVIGAIPDEIAEWHGLTREALENARAAVRPGVTGRAVWEEACAVYEAAGHPTQRTKDEGVVLRDGFFHSLGHGVGLEVHEDPSLGRTGSAELIPGDVITLEPGTYRQGFGGVRLEDLVLVTEDGAETLTDFSYELTP